MTHHEILAVIKEIAARHHTNWRELQSGQRRPWRARKEIAIALRERGLTYELIGHYLNRHHTTIMHHVGAL